VADTLGWILVEGGKTEEGLPLLRAAAQAPDATADVKYHYAAGLARAGSAGSARTELEALLKDPAPFASRAEAQKLLAELGSSGASGG
jgi:thioredoxin-like negative regulator of GroEL